MPPSSKITRKSKVPAGSAKQAFASGFKNGVKLPSAGYKIVDDVHEKDLCGPAGKGLRDEPGRAWTDPDWYTDLEDRMGFETEYAHLCNTWDKAGCDQLLKKTFANIRDTIPLDQAINIGLGNFACKVLVPVEGKFLEGRNKQCGPSDRCRKPDHSGARNQVTSKTFLMAPLIFNVLPEIMEPTGKAAGLYVGNRMARMINSSLPGVELEDFRKLVAPFDRYRRITDAKDLPPSVKGFLWTQGIRDSIP